MSDTIETGGPAFPFNYGQQGMTLRDYFAAAALTGMLASPARDYDFDGAADDAYRYADAMIRERDRQ